MGGKKRKKSVQAAADAGKITKKVRNEEIFKRTGVWEKLTDVIESIKNKRFKPVAERLHQQLIDQTRHCVGLISAFGQYWGKKLAAEKSENEMDGGDEEDVDDENCEQRADFRAFWEEVKRRAVAEGRFAICSTCSF